MTIKEFIKKTLFENNLNYDPDKVEKSIKEEVKKQAVNGVAAISDEDVKRMILEYKPEEEIDTDIKDGSLSKSPVEQEKEKKCEEEQKPYQTVLF